MDNLVLVLPLRAIALQLLFLAVTVAIESYVFHRQLNLHRRSSVVCSAVLNLVTNTIGWFFFFNIELILPNSVRENLINLLLFSEWNVANLPWTILGGIGVFVIGWFVKRQGFEVLQNLHDIWTERKRNEGGFAIAANQSFIEQSRARIIFRAHIFSNSTILVMAVLQVITIDNKNLILFQ
ncbi:filament integrity protein FraC [Roseofilum casamattae]|uniref:Filament integrity protein n=1 Tax=Roseofilum casamattae BLCC-M143 TaxID=3022442 RepID=A0ABT7BTT8_9CYAN|nr:filament integrity protein FraC [Roseofilum casamattae]MDJ1182597.1 hypothetical protein [Roseofilum casamattae BLCC-M143]